MFDEPLLSTPLEITRKGTSLLIISGEIEKKGLICSFTFPSCSLFI